MNVMSTSKPNELKLIQENSLYHLFILYVITESLLCGSNDNKNWSVYYKAYEDKPEKICPCPMRDRIVKGHCHPWSCDLVSNKRNSQPSLAKGNEEFLKEMAPMLRPQGGDICWLTKGSFFF